MYHPSVGTSGKLDVANERRHIVQTEDVLVTPPVHSLQDARSWSGIVTVPSGGLFGLDPEEKIVFTLPASVEGFYPAEGGTVAVQRRGRRDETSTMSGELTTAQNDDE